MHKFFLIGRGSHQGWWLLVDNSELLFTVHRMTASGLFLKFQKNPHLKDAYMGHTAVTLAAKWLQTAEKLFMSAGFFFVNPAGGLMTGKLDKLDIIEQREIANLAFPPNQIETRRITISRWYGGEHFYLQSQDQLVFSKDKFDTLDEAMREARAYALESNIAVADAKHLYTKEGD